MACGENVYAGDSHAEAKVVAVGTMNGKEVFCEEFTFVVYNPVAADVEALTIPGAEDIRGNITKYLEIFERFIPPIAGISFAPVVALLVIYFVNNYVLYWIANIIRYVFIR